MVVDFGYDLHEIYISETTFSQIQAGQPLVVEGQGFPVEGVMEQDQWAFNYGAVGSVYVSTVEGREVFEGNLGDAEVAVRGAGVDLPGASTTNDNEEHREGDASR